MIRFWLLLLLRGVPAWPRNQSYDDGFSLLQVTLSKVGVVPQNAAHEEETEKTLHDGASLLAHGGDGDEAKGTMDPMLLAIVLLVPFVFGGFYSWNRCGIDAEIDAGETMSAKKQHILKKLHRTSSNTDWRIRLGKVLESSPYACISLCFTLADLGCTLSSTLLEDTDLLNPKYKTQGEIASDWIDKIGFDLLFIFLTESTLLLIAFGMKFYRHFFYMMDLVVVYVNFLTETVSSGYEVLVGWTIILRLWKICGVVADLLDLSES